MKAGTPSWHQSVGFGTDLPVFCGLITAHFNYHTPARCGINQDWKTFRTNAYCLVRACSMFVSLQLIIGMVAGFLLGGCCLTVLTLVVIGAWASGVAWREIGEPDEPQPPPIAVTIKQRD